MIANFSNLLLGISFGLFLGNWLIVPIFFKKRTHKDGFFIGLIAMILTLILWIFVK